MTDRTFSIDQTDEDVKALQKPVPKEGLIKTWSHSRVKNFESCKYRVYLASVVRAPRPPQSQAADRGNRVHKAAEDYVQGETDTLAYELRHFSIGMNRLKEMYNEGIVDVEDDWGFTKDWEHTPVNYKDPALWGVVKIDVLVREAEDSAIVIDYKTGKKKGNEISHMDQGMTYAISTFMRFPRIEMVQTEFWYLDEKDKLIKTFTRDQAIMLLPNLERRANELTDCVDFPPSPSKSTCLWCPHKQTDSCDFAE